MRRVILGIIALFSVLDLYAQSGVGIGTANPNPNAVLDVVSTSNDKGILIPRLTTGQRVNMATSLAAGERGLLVFDSELNSFFFWNGSDWNTINVVQDLQLSGNTLTITNNSAATSIDLAPFAGANTDNQTLTLSGTNLDISGGNTVDLGILQDGINDADADPTNELQSITKAGNTVSLSNGGGSFTDAINDADADPTNEIQNISTTGAAGNISLTGGATLNLNVSDSDADPTNEIQALAKAGNTVSLSNGGGSFTDEVNDADANPTNELQTISKAGNTVSLSNGGGSFTDEVNDADNNPNNEIQDLTLVGSTLRITNNVAATDIDLSPFAGTNTDNQTLSVSGTDLSITGGNTVDLSPLQDGVTDADADPANEIQTLSKVGSTVSLSNGGGSFTDQFNDADANPTNEIQTLSKVGSNVSLSNGGGSFNDDTGTDDQRLSFAGTILTIEDGNNVNLSSLQDGVTDADADPSNEFQTITKVGNTVSLSDGGGSFTDDTGTDDQRLSFAGTILTIEDGNNVNLSSLQDGVTDADADPSNEFQTVSKVGNTVTLSDGGGSFTDEVNDADASATNELQNLSSSNNGTNRTINITSGTGTTFSVADNDNSPSNEFQNLSLAGNTLSISNGNSVNLPSSSTTRAAFKAFEDGGTLIGVGKNVLRFNQERYDIGDLYDEGGGVVKPPVDGIYQFAGNLTLRQADGLGNFSIEVLIEGNPIFTKRVYTTVETNGNDVSVDFNCEAFIAAGQVVEFQITMESKPGNLAGGINANFITGRLVLE